MTFVVLIWTPLQILILQNPIHAMKILGLIHNLPDSVCGIFHNPFR